MSPAAVGQTDAASIGETPATTGRRSIGRCIAGLLLVVLIPFACARMSPIRATPSVEADCQRFFEELDAMTAAARARDAGVVGVSGAPYLGADRFLASFSGEIASAEAYAEWLERLRAADAERRTAELANLGIGLPGDGPSSPFPGFSPIEVIGECGRRLVARDLHSVERLAWLRRRVLVPDAYSIWRRLLGVYPLTRLAIGAGVGALHRELRDSFVLPIERLQRQGRLLRYAPDAAAPVAADLVASLLRTASRNALRIPEPDPANLQRLYEAFAPIWEIDTGGTSDRIGAVRWNPRGRPEIDTGAPVVYRFITHTRFHSDPLLQLNYLIWFPERRASRPFDLYSGRLDGLIWRVTVSSEGRALAYDTIHPCGCYYLLFPGIGYRVVQPADDSEPVVSPYPLAAPKRGQRHVVRVSSGRHFVQAVYSDDAMQLTTVYRWRDLRELLSLPTAGGSRHSLFDQEGLVAHTDRRERFLLWPSGIANPGAMRQPGTHAIAMLGRRHFDDAHLLEQLLHRL